MNKRILQLSIIFTALGITANMHAYRWLFSNFTDSAIILQVELLGSGNPYFVYVHPEKTADFDWGAGNPRGGHCLGKIKFMEIKKPARDPLLTKLLQNKVIVNNKVADNGRMLEFCDQYQKIYPRVEGHLKFQEDALFNETVANAKKLIGPAAQWIGDIMKETACRSRDIAVVREDNGSVGFYTKAN